MRKIFNFTIQTLKNTDFIKEIIKNGWKPYLVGGCVRDYIMNKQSNDIDMIIVGCDKEELINLLDKYGKPDLVGESFAVIKYHHKGEIYDISTPRTEKKISDGHKGFEVITNKNITLEQDLFRRDITINSIAMDFEGNFIDPFNGIKDIKNKIIKITNSEAFIDDPLRVLRCVRFCARFNFKIEKNTLNLILKTKSNISQLSQERILDEFYKILKFCQNDDDNVKIMQTYVDLLTEFDMWKQMFGNININTNLKIESLSDAIIFLDIFWNNKLDSDFRKKLIQDLKLQQKVINEIYFLQKLYNNINDDKVFHLANLKKRFHIKDRLIIDFAYIKNLDSKFIVPFLSYCEIPFEIDGNDLMKQGFRGEDIGIEKNRLEVQRFKEKFRNKY